MTSLSSADRAWLRNATDEHMTTFDVHVEYVNGQTSWLTLTAVDADTAERVALGENVNAHVATAHEHGTRPGFRRQGRRV